MDIDICAIVVIVVVVVGVMVVVDETIKSFWVEMTVEMTVKERRKFENF